MLGQWATLDTCKNPGSWGSCLEEGNSQRWTVLLRSVFSSGNLDFGVADWGMKNSVASYCMWVINGNFLQDAAWHHVLYIPADHPSGTPAFYVDGVPQVFPNEGSRNCPHPYPTHLNMDDVVSSMDAPSVFVKRELAVCL